jgi:hypothetical protein
MPKIRVKLSTLEKGKTKNYKTLKIYEDFLKIENAFKFQKIF